MGYGLCEKIEIRKFIEIGDLEINRDWMSTISHCEICEAN